MPSVSPGEDETSVFEHILPGLPTPGYQSLTTLTFRWKRYILYLSGPQLNILRGPVDLAQAIILEEEPVALASEDGDGGRFAVATKTQAWVFKPATSISNRVTWVQELRLKSNDEGNNIHTLSWGTEGELLLGGTKELCSYNTLPSSRVTSPGADAINAPEIRGAQWSKPVANPVRFAVFSPSAGLIASTGQTDRLVKIWRRLSYEEAIFDYAYLPHRGIVTHLEWRPSDVEKLELVPSHSSSVSHHDDSCDVLYTISTDGLISIWRTNNHNDVEIMSLYTTIDLVSAIPHSPILTTSSKTYRPQRHAFVIPASAYTGAVDSALKQHSKSEVKHAIEHLKEVASRQPDVVVVLDAQGRMSAWGLSSIGHRLSDSPGSMESPFHIAHSEHMGLSFQPDLPTTFYSWFDGDMLNVIAHNFTQDIKWWRGTVENFSSSAALDIDRGHVMATWQGSQNIDNVRSLSTPAGFVTCSEEDGLKTWSIGESGQYVCSNIADIDTTFLDVVEVGTGFVCVNDRTVSLSSLANSSARHDLPEYSNSLASRILRLEQISSIEPERFVIFNEAGQYTLLTLDGNLLSEPTAWQEVELGNHSKIVALDAVLHPRKSEWLRVIAVDKSGTLLRRDTPCASLGDSIEPSEQTMRFTAGISVGRLAITSSCAALLSSQNDELIILDLKEGYIEHQQKLSTAAHNIAFPRQGPESSQLTEHSILAVSCDTSVTIFMRTRYDHQHRGGNPHWTTIKNVSIGPTGLSISNITWLGDHQLAITTKHSMFITTNTLDPRLLDDQRRQELELTDDTEMSLNALASLMQGPVTCWQPHILRQLILHGQFDAVVLILSQLQTKLRFFSNGDHLDAMLGLDINTLLAAQSSFTDDVDLSELRDQLQELDLPFTSDQDQQKLQLVAQTVTYVLRHRGSLDLNAVRYLAHWRYHVLLDHTHHATTNGTTNGASQHAVDGATQKVIPQMGWREINFAYHSSTQQPLLELLIQYYENKLDWTTVRSLGITLWMHNIRAAQSEGASMASVEQVFDALAQNAYRASDPPNPADASLYLLALRKKPVLLSLWRVAVGNREQKSTRSFLQRDFNVEENKTAARKNAYALMGRRRFEYAAAFFLLADDPLSAISVLAGQLEDLPLALSVARAYCGDGSDVIVQFLRQRVVSDAQKRADRWLLSWTHALMAEPGQMLQTLVANVSDIAKGDSVLARSWTQDDPVALVFYRELRDKNRLQAPPTNEEYRAVLRAARVLRRMGFWLLALKLVSSWTFISKVSEDNIPAVKVEEATPALNMLDQFDDEKGPEVKVSTPPLVMDALETSPRSTKPALSEADERKAKAAALLAKIRAKNAKTNGSSEVAPNEAIVTQPTQFKEPAASSILDSFGF